MKPKQQKKYDATVIHGREKTDLYDPELGMTQSLMSDWTMCRQRAAYKLKGWRSTKESEAILLGDLVHACLGEMHTQTRKKHYRTASAVELVADRVIQAWSSRMRQTLGDPDLLDRVMALAKALLPAYIRFYPKDFLEVRWIEAEKMFDVNFKGFRLRGRRDGVFEARVARLSLQESKVKGRVASELEDCLSFDFQCLFYLLALRLELNKAVYDVSYNVIRRPQLKQGQKEESADFIERIAADIQKRPDHYFMRYPLTFSRETQLRFAEELYGKLQDFSAWRQGVACHYRSETSCLGRGACPFIEACASGSMAGYRYAGTLFPELETLDVEEAKP